MTKVSTIIATHNRASVLGQAIESVLTQGVEDHEVIVVDDNSTDNTPEVVAQYPVRHISVKCGKPSMTRNAGIRAATGVYIAFLDDDDVWLPNRLAPAVARLDADPDAVMVYAQVQLTDWTLTDRGWTFPPFPLAEGHPVREFLEDVIHVNGLLVRKSALDAVGLFDETTWGAEDMDFTVRLARAGKCLAIQECVALLRVPQDGVSDATKSIGGHTDTLLARHKDDVRLLEKHFAIPDAYQPSANDKKRILRKRNGWFVGQLIDQADKAKRAGASSERVRALRAAFGVSTLHCLISARYWKLLVG